MSEVEDPSGLQSPAFGLTEGFRQCFLSHPMYARNFRRAAQTRRFSVTTTAAFGWEVREEQNSRVIRIVRYDDWHRVERALLHFAREAVALRESGWVEA